MSSSRRRRLKGWAIERIVAFRSAEGTPAGYPYLPPFSPNRLDPLRQGASYNTMKVLAAHWKRCGTLFLLIQPAPVRERAG